MVKSYQKRPDRPVDGQNPRLDSRRGQSSARLCRYGQKGSASWPVSRVLYGPRALRRGNVAAILLGRVLPRVSRNQPGRWAGNSPEGCPSYRPYSVLLPVGFTLPLLLPVARWALTPPFHPYRENRGGLLSVALSLGSPPPAINRHRVSMEPGLSSPAAFRRMQVRPPGQLTRRIKRVMLEKATENVGCHFLHRRRSEIRRPQGATAPSCNRLPKSGSCAWRHDPHCT